MKILSIDTSCDETACAVTNGTKILSNIIWSQVSAHAKFGGVLPSLAQRMHSEHIDRVVKQAINNSQLTINKIDAIAVTVGPGLSIALGVGVNKAKELAKKHHKKLIAVNHLEGHILSPLASPANAQLTMNNPLRGNNLQFPALGLVASGGNTILVKINKVGSHETLAQTTDDALGEALDKAARMLGLGYPGGAILEKMARSTRLTRSGQARRNPYILPIPIVGQEERKIFTYSGLKTAMNRLIETKKPLTKEKVYNLAACFQDVAFTHLIRVLRYCIIHKQSLASQSTGKQSLASQGPGNSSFVIHNLLVGGGVAANVELRRRLRKLGREFRISVHFPYSNKLTGDNAAMIGIAAYFKAQRGEFVDPDKIDRDPRAKLSHSEAKW